MSVKRESIVIVTYCYATKPRNPEPSGQSLTLFCLSFNWIESTQTEVYLSTPFSNSIIKFVFTQIDDNMCPQKKLKRKFLNMC